LLVNTIRTKTKKTTTETKTVTETMNVMKISERFLFLSLERYIRYKNYIKNWINEKLMTNSINEKEFIKQLQQSYQHELAIQQQYNQTMAMSNGSIASTANITYSPLVPYNGYPQAIHPLSNSIPSYWNNTSTTSVSAIGSFNELINLLKRMDSILDTDYFESIDVQTIIEEMREKIVSMELDNIKQKMLK